MSVATVSEPAIVGSPIPVDPLKRTLSVPHAPPDDLSQKRAAFQSALERSDPRY